MRHVVDLAPDRLRAVAIRHRTPKPLPTCIDTTAPEGGGAAAAGRRPVDGLPVAAPYAERVSVRITVRRVANVVNLSTPLGLLLGVTGGARFGRGPHGVIIAHGYRSRIPAPRASAVTVGDVVLLRLDPGQLAQRPRLLDHEARHSAQWAWFLGPVGFLPAYLAASAWSWWRCRDFALRNAFEVRADLVDGGYLHPGPPDDAAR
jgi:hypothetical protein